MSILKKVSQEIEKKANERGIPLVDFSLLKSNRKDLGDYQINDCMTLSKTLHKAPYEIAKELEEVLVEMEIFQNINIAGPGFINLTLKDTFLQEELNQMQQDFFYNIDKEEEKTIFMDYGGANIAKTLHVGHLRSANLGEANKHLAQFLGLKVISDVHFGDIGRQSGMVLYEMRRRYPHLNYFKEEIPSSYDALPITAQDLEEIYPAASTLAKENEEVMEEVRSLTKQIEEGNPNLCALWNAIKAISVEDIKGIYKRLHTDFDLWEGETDCYPYMEKTIEMLKEANVLVESEGAQVISVSTEDEKAPMPPLVVLKSNGGTVYGTRELATIVARTSRFHPDEFWYFADNRQALYFEQVFRASYKAHLVEPSVRLAFYGFGTMNGKDGKPFKTRDGNLATLTSLLDMVKEEIGKKLSDKIDEDKRETIKEQITIATVKYADFLSNRTTDYIFDIEKFTDLEGKTGPYLLYSTIRMKSLLKKVMESSSSLLAFKDQKDREVALLLLDLPGVLTRSYKEKSLHEIADYLYTLTSSYNSFYQDHYILSEENDEYKKTWIALTQLVSTVNETLLKILGIEIPEMM